MDIASSIEKTLFVVNAFMRQKKFVDDLENLKQSLENLKYKWQQKKIDQAEASQTLHQIQKRLLMVFSVENKEIRAGIESVSADKSLTLINTIYDQLNFKRKAAKTKSAKEGPVSKSKKALLKFASKLFPFLKVDNTFDIYPEFAEDAAPLDAAMRNVEEYQGYVAKPSKDEMAGAELPGPLAPPAYGAAYENTPLPAKGKILYDIPDSMKVSRQQKCVVRIAKDELTAKDNDTFTDTVKLEDIVLSGVMKVELIDIAEPPHFNIKTVSSAEQEVDAESYTEWLFWVIPLMSGVYDLILKVSIIKTINGKERRKDLVFEKAVNILADSSEGIPHGVVSAVANGVSNTGNVNLKNLADEKNVSVIDPPAVFISYAHKDKAYFDIFSDNLRSQSGWNIWTDLNIEIGAGWFTRIQDSIKASDFAVLLVSSNFISSGFIKQNEFAAFMQLEKSKPGFAFLPVLLRDVDFTRWKELAALQFFVAYGDEYGVPELKTKMIPFAKLCRFDNNNQLIPNDNMDTYFKNFVAKVEKDWLRNRKN